MKKTLLKFAVVNSLAFISAQAMAGLVALPATGLAVAAGNNQPSGTTPYVGCAQQGGVNCVVTPANDFTSPVAGYTLLNSVTNAAVTANGVSQGKRSTRVFRTADQKMCIFATQFQMDFTNPLAVTDISFAGFSKAASVNAGYFFKPGSSSPLYRVGRTYTAATGSVLRPITASAPAASTSINGLSGTAALSPNWVTFKLFVQGTSSPPFPFSHYMYIEAPCKDASPLVAGSPVALTDGIVLKQSINGAFVTIKTPSSYSPQGASATLY